MCGGGGGGVSPRGWVCLGETLVFASCSLTVVFARCASPGQLVRAHGPSRSLACLFNIVNIIMLYSLQYRYYQVCEIIFFTIFYLV